ncbi:hypothetical protein C489_09126 [Natrinema versiforme JCM 10478]|uniref:DUF7964 domain-containing protein n=2 Tax=Natrinema versiforme TaxID=88724 RepID=L9Y0Z3_9EURY|nr:hypothetical protein C489_09126 [Natrinema versiforme JCM 10478]
MPVSQGFLDKLEKHESVIGIVPMKMDRQGETIYVYDFTIELENIAYALRYDQTDGWTIIAKDEDVETVGLALQEYHHENGI